MVLDKRISDYTNRLNASGLLRSRKINQRQQPGFLYFDSNDYLSLTQDKRVAQAYQDGYAKFPCGSGGSMVLSGYHPNHQALERAFAEFLAVDDCLLFSSGYAANLAVTALLAKINAHCLIDKNVHASVYDGLRQAQLPFSRFIHNDLLDLVGKINAESVIFTEGIFSMSGQRAPLLQMAQHGLPLIVDEAHSFGVIGMQGRGAVDAHGLSQNDVPLRIIPFGKALGGQGAVVAGKSEWITALLQAGRSIIYSTAPGPASSHGLLTALEVLMQADDRRLALKHLIDEFHRLICLSPLQWSNSDTPIQQVKLGCPFAALKYAQALHDEGIACSAIRAPTVSRNASGLRIIINCQHSPRDLQRLFEQLAFLYAYSSH